MKRLVCFFMVVLFAALLVVPCFAAETLVDRGDPVDWFGSVSGYSYTVTGTPANLPNGPTSAVTASSAISLTPSITVPAGASWYVVFYTGNNYEVYINGSLQNSYVTYTNAPWTLYLVESEYHDRNNTLYSGIPIGSDGFVDAGFSDALTELSTIVSAILSNQYILIAIGLSVAVPLVAWGISKIKSLVKGY